MFVSKGPGYKNKPRPFENEPQWQHTEGKPLLERVQIKESAVNDGLDFIVSCENKLRYNEKIFRRIDEIGEWRQQMSYYAPNPLFWLKANVRCRKNPWFGQTTTSSHRACRESHSHFQKYFQTTAIRKLRHCLWRATHWEWKDSLSRWWLTHTSTPNTPKSKYLADLCLSRVQPVLANLHWSMPY